MNLIKTKLDGLVVLKPNIFKDNRGCFMESYNQKNINKLLGNVNFVQDNESESTRGVLRGLHLQLINAQAKLITVLYGKIFDVCVDCRKNSKSFGKYFSINLSDKDNKSLEIQDIFQHIVKKIKFESITINENFQIYCFFV